MSISLNRIPLKAKLLLIAVVPIIFIGFLSTRYYTEKTRYLNLMRTHIARIQQSANITRLIEQLQRERRYSFDYALNKTSRNELIAQRPKTDSIINILVEKHDAHLKEFTLYTSLNKIDSIRDRIDSGLLVPNQVMQFYSGSIFRVNTLNNLPGLLNKSLIDIYAELNVQKLLSELITYQGIINSNIYNILYTRQYMAETLYGTYGTYDVYKSYLEELEVKSEGNVAYYKKLVSNPQFISLNNYLDSVFKTFSIDSSYTPQSWLVLTDSTQNYMRAMQANLLQGIEYRLTEYYNKESASRNRAIVYLVLATAIIIFLVVYMLALINNSLIKLKNAALKISEGKTGIDLDPATNDAIGSLATSIKDLDEKNKELALTAKRIGEGDFNVTVTPRSKEDILGNSLLQMKENLLRSTMELEKSREEFIQLADFTPQVVWTASPDGQINYYNKRWYEITGAKPGFGDQSWIPVLHPDDVGNCLTTWYRSVESGEPYQIEYRFKDVRTGTYRWFLGRALPIKDEKGNILKWFGTATDIHDQKILNEKLEDLVAQRTLELKRSNEDLQQFAHVASHDLKEPVRKLRTFSDRLESEYGSIIPEKGKVYLEKLKLSSERMSKMIDSILSYSVINSTNDTFETVDLNLVIENIIIDLELVIIQKEATIKYKNLPLIKAIPTLIHQLFYNLVNNALKFAKTDLTPVIEITGELKTAEAIKEKEGLPKADQYIEINVIDNGIGFEQQYANQLFNVFTRLNSREKYEGTGLGLALCKKIVHRHQGIIYAQSKPGSGAVFTIILPQ
ncbi:MAG TPA: ATP-binding protein [Chitinophagaceae bacterium]